MTYPTDDLAPLLVPHPDPTVKWGQATVVSWDPDTFRSTIRWRGALYVDMPVLSNSGPLSLRPGDEVVLQGFTSGEGASTWYIAGMVVFPGTEAGARAIEFMTSSLAKQIAKAVFVEGVRSAVVPGQEGTASTTFVDLATVGPTVADVEISATGVAVVFINAGILAGGNSSLASQGGAMSFAVTGASSRSPVLDNSRSLQFGVAIGDMGDIGTPSSIDRSASMIVVTGLNPGVHTFQAKYRALGSPTATGLFNQRSLAVIGL